MSKRITNVALRKTVQLRRIFKRDLSPVLVPPVPISFPYNEVRSTFADSANKVLSKQNLKLLQTQQIPQPRRPEAQVTLPSYSPFACEPEIEETEVASLDVDHYLNVDVNQLQDPRLPYLPSTYFKTPNQTYVTKDTPFITSKFEIKGILSPFTQLGFLRLSSYQFNSPYFSLKFLPTSYFLSAVRKSKPAMVMTASNELLFNDVTNSQVPRKLIKSSFFPNRAAVRRKQIRTYYRDLYYNFMHLKEENKRDGILVVRCKKFPFTVEEKAAVAKKFEEAMIQVYKAKLHSAPPDKELLRITCLANGLSYLDLYGIDF